MTEDEKRRFSDAFKDYSAGRITIDEACDLLESLGVTRLGIVSVMPEGQSKN